MARQVVVTLVDDYDGKSKAEETVRFGIDGVEYEIDLSMKNAGKLREALEPWTGTARRLGRVPRGKGSKTTAKVDRDRSAAIREWARKKNIAVSSRGRIAAEVVEAYEKAGV
ncbi:histone-like nucleoid-structuring protein Lsr2 [Nocardia brasiliensis]|uniref:histone-like nucleoid-structuring protein Lsr2 n=1 Tax=Nocardia brasiliensis TaxID=37326 RepID=UPI002455A3D5|nr:Lsr2 family protein [Nocardia brasiliensis]